MTAEDIPEAVALQRACFPEPFPADLLWNRDHLARHLETFQEGQFVAIADGRIVASCSNCIISELNWRAHRSWTDTVGGPLIENHDPDGSTLYGLDVSVHPDFRGQGLMRALYDLRFCLVRESKSLVRYGTGVRIPGYASYQLGNPAASPEDYVKAVTNGATTDRTLTPMIRVGLKPIGVITNYMEDMESHNAAALLEWRP